MSSFSHFSLLKIFGLSEFLSVWNGILNLIGTHSMSKNVKQIRLICDFKLTFFIFQCLECNFPFNKLKWIFSNFLKWKLSLTFYLFFSTYYNACYNTCYNLSLIKFYKILKLSADLDFILLMGNASQGKGTPLYVRKIFFDYSPKENN